MKQPETYDPRDHCTRRKILFVCLGNICRSPAAEAVMKSLIRKECLEDRFTIDSAGISSYHRGDLADPRMRACAARRGYTLLHRSRPVRSEDFEDFDLIIGMDDSNIDELLQMSPDIESDAKVHRMTDYCKTKVADHVPDPYYDGGFDNVLDILEDACSGLLESEKKALGIG